jgi:hypothetical protein
MFYKIWLIPMFTRSKWAAKGRLENWTVLCLIYALLFSARPDGNIFCPDGPHRITILTQFCIIIGFRVWWPINTCFIDPKTWL